MGILQIAWPSLPPPPHVEVGTQPHGAGHLQWIPGCAGQRTASHHGAYGEADAAADPRSHVPIVSFRWPGTSAGTARSFAWSLFGMRLVFLASNVRGSRSFVIANSSPGVFDIAFGLVETTGRPMPLGLTVREDKVARLEI